MRALVVHQRRPPPTFCHHPAWALLHCSSSHHLDHRLPRRHAAHKGTAPVLGVPHPQRRFEVHRRACNQSTSDHPRRRRRAGARHHLQLGRTDGISESGPVARSSPFAGQGQQADEGDCHHARITHAVSGQDRDVDCDGLRGVG